MTVADPESRPLLRTVFVVLVLKLLRLLVVRLLGFPLSRAGAGACARAGGGGGGGGAVEARAGAPDGAARRAYTRRSHQPEQVRRPSKAHAGTHHHRAHSSINIAVNVFD